MWMTKHLHFAIAPHTCAALLIRDDVRTHGARGCYLTPGDKVETQSYAVGKLIRKPVRVRSITATGSLHGTTVDVIRYAFMPSEYGSLIAICISRQYTQRKRDSS